MNGDQRLRVYNKCHYDIGVTLTNNTSVNIRPNSFQILTINDILYIESICNSKKYFSSKMLVPVDDNEKELTLNDLGGFTDEYAEKHLNNEDIALMLKKSAKQIEAWLDGINDPEELHAIYEVAKESDLSASKLKILNAKIPSKDWLDE